MEHQIPIDIHYNKLLDWLIDRRHCNLKWQNSALEVREKINSAIQDMPPNEDIANLLSGTYINYFHCLKIIELLKKCGEGSTNFFGQYSSQRMKDWIDLLQLYKEDNIYLAEASHLLIRNVNYEIPSLKKQIGKCQQTQRDCSKRETEYISNAATFKEKYHQVCKEMGVHGEDVRKELLSLVDVLPELFKRISEETRDLEEVIDYYAAFIDFVLPKHDASDEESGCKVDHQVAPMISFICKNGNATVYQWRTGERPLAVATESGGVQIILESNKAEDCGIDFGDEGDNIDFGIEAVANESEANIDFGIETVSNDNEADIDFGIETVDEDGIDFGIETVDIKIEDSGNEGIEIQSEKCSGDSKKDIASDADFLSVLEQSATRNIFTDELIEIQSFLSQRLEELSTEGDILSASQFQSAPTIIQTQTKENIRNLLYKVSSVIENLTSMKMQNLYRLKNSPRYVDRLADSIQQKLKTANNLIHQAKIMVERREAALELQRETEPKLQIIIEKTKELKIQISNEISSKYKNRTVNIMGEINSI